MKPEQGSQKRNTLRTYIIFAVLGFLTSTALVYGAVSFTPFQPGEVLNDEALNSRLEAIESYLGINTSQLSCKMEFELVESGTNPASYSPAVEKRAELFQYGWLCWNRLATDPITPNSPGVAHSQYWGHWDAQEQKVCGRITQVAGNFILARMDQVNYYGLRNLDGTNTTHGYWSNSDGGYTGPSGQGDYWGIFTCR